MLPRHLLALLFGLIAPRLASVRADTLLQDSPGQAQDVLQHKPITEATCEQFPTGPIETTDCDFETLESVNDELYTQLHELVQMPFFKYFRTDLYRECPYWEENGLCMNRECGVTTVDESEIPEQWRAAALSKVENSPQEHLPGCHSRDADYCFLDDPTADGEYIDLSLNPERFTGYVGPSAHRVWASIYQENCFGLSELTLMRAPSAAPATLPESMFEVMRVDGESVPEECLEHRVYYKIISGLHASITTHICRDTLNQTTGEWGPDLQCFVDRVASHPERLQYIYFDTVLLLRAVARLAPYLSAYDYCGTGTHEDDAATLARLAKVIDIARAVGKFDERVLFRGENANILKEEFKEHFRNVSRIMDCVGCDKCKLWGKVQTTGLATALKVLFELDEKALSPQTNHNLLQRSEVVALVNTLHRFSESLEAVNDFRRMWQQAQASPAQAARKPHRSPTAGAPFDNAFLADVWERAERWLRACTEGTVECVRGVVDAATAMVDTVLGVFRVGGKEGGLRSEL